MSADFLDTNVFVYSFDDTEPAKRDTSLRLIREALLRGQAVISFQVVQEFLSVATRKFAQPLSAEDAERYLKNVLRPLCMVWPAIELYAAALSLARETGYSFHDSLIVAAALEAGCKRLLTEDLQDGQTIRGLTITNPFRIQA